LVINPDGSVNVYDDPTQPPYDGSEDALIGVVNNSSATVTHLTLNGTTQPFGFDGDGICAYEGVDCSGNTQDSTGYGGPISYFTNIDTETFNSGDVNFSGGLAPSASAYFSLEGIVTAETIVVAQPTSLTTSLSGGAQSGAQITVPPGTAVTDSATLSGSNASSATGTVTYTVYSDSGCGTAVANGGTKTIVTPGSMPNSDPVTLNTPGQYYWRATYSGDTANATSTSTCGAEIETVAVNLATSKVGAPEPVTAGNDVQYVVTVTNNGTAAVAGVSTTDTLPAGTTFVSASSGCTGTGPVTCSLGTINGGASKSVNIVVKTSASQAGQTIVNTATTSPGGSSGTFTTHVIAPTGNSAAGYVPPGGSISTGGDNPATLTLPPSGPGAVVIMNQTTGAKFCAGTCDGPVTQINNFPGYNDPHQPIDLKLTYSAKNYGEALSSLKTAKVYKLIDDPSSPKFGQVIVIPDCKDDPSWTAAQKQAAAQRRAQGFGTQSHIADPHPCVDSRSVTQRSDGVWQTTFEVLYLSGDGTFGHR
jgi:uncharacterized repeat protein (TIGR01451 family)